MPNAAICCTAIILLLFSCIRITSFCTLLSQIMSAGWIAWENKLYFLYYLLYFAVSWPAVWLGCKREQVTNSNAALEKNKNKKMYWNRLKKIFLPAGAARCINAYFIFNGAVWTFFDIILIYLFPDSFHVGLFLLGCHCARLVRENVQFAACPQKRVGGWGGAKRIWLMRSVLFIYSWLFPGVD